MTEPSQRASRWPLHIPIAFRAEDRTLEGYTLNVSASGLLAAFPRPLDVWTEGELEMLAGGFYLTIPARVARVQGQETGMSFLIHTENDGRAVEILLASASGSLIPDD